MNIEAMRNTLGRIYEPDERDRRFLMSSVVPEAPPERRWRYWWPSGWWGNQELTSHCVSYSWLHWIEDGPVTHPQNPTVPVLDPAELYHRAQLADAFPGTDYDGTTVRAGARVLQAEGYIGTYRWAWDMPTVVNALLTTGPVIMGSWWWTGMWEPQGDDALIVPRGSREGGHAYVLNGINLDRGIVRLKNSWGRGWGRRGYAYLSLDDAATLLEDWGEVCLAEERRVA